MNLAKIHRKFIDRKLKANQHTVAVIGTGGDFVVPDSGLDEAAHDALDHTGLTGVPSITGLLNETTHDALDHTGLTGVATDFTDLGDVPAAYTGEGGKIVAVKADVSGLEFVAAPAAENGVPVGGTTNQLAAKNSNDDYDIKWMDAPSAANGIPAGGTAGQLLAKVDADDYDCEWVNDSLNLIASAIVSGSAVTSVQFTGLDINTDKDWVLVAKIINSSGSNMNLSAYVNADTTNTNYRCSTHWADSDGHDKASADAVKVGECNNGRWSLNITDIGLVNGYALFMGKSISGNTTGSTVVHFHSIKETSETNITQLDLTSTVANGIGVGSEFRLYRRG